MFVLLFTIVLSVVLKFTASYYPCGIFKLFLWHVFQYPLFTTNQSLKSRKRRLSVKM